MQGSSTHALCAHMQQPASRARCRALSPSRGSASATSEAATAQTASRTEQLIADLESELQAESSGGEEDADVVAAAEAQLQQLNNEVDQAYQQYFRVGEVVLQDGSARHFDGVSEAEMQQLGRTEPQVRRTCCSARYTAAGCMLASAQAGFAHRLPVRVAVCAPETTL